MNGKNNRFARGSGCFECKVCGKLTRAVGAGDNAGCEMCELCFEISSCENSLSDNGWGKHGDLSHCKTVAECYAEFERLRAAKKLCDDCKRSPEGMCPSHWRW